MISSNQFGPSALGAPTLSECYAPLSLKIWTSAARCKILEFRTWDLSARSQRSGYPIATELIRKLLAIARNVKMTRPINLADVRAALIKDLAIILCNF
jgi:hypothetical protein